MDRERTVVRALHTICTVLKTLSSERMEKEFCDASCMELEAAGDELLAQEGAAPYAAKKWTWPHGDLIVMIRFQETDGWILRIDNSRAGPILYLPINKRCADMIIRVFDDWANEYPKDGYSCETRITRTE